MIANQFYLLMGAHKNDFFAETEGNAFWMTTVGKIENYCDTIRFGFIAFINITCVNTCLKLSKKSSM